MADIDGALCGGWSLSAEEFVAIAEAAHLPVEDVNRAGDAMALLEAAVPDDADDDDFYGTDKEGALGGQC